MRPGVGVEPARSGRLAVDVEVPVCEVRWWHVLLMARVQVLLIRGLRSRPGRAPNVAMASSSDKAARAIGAVPLTLRVLSWIRTPGSVLLSWNTVCSSMGESIIRYHIPLHAHHI